MFWTFCIVSRFFYPSCGCESRLFAEWELNNAPECCRESSTSDNRPAFEQVWRTWAPSLQSLQTWLIAARSHLVFFFLFLSILGKRSEGTIWLKQPTLACFCLAEAGSRCRSGTLRLFLTRLGWISQIFPMTHIAFPVSWQPRASPTATSVRVQRSGHVSYMPCRVLFPI